MSRRNIYFILGKSQRVPVGDAKGSVPYEKVLSTASLCKVIPLIGEMSA